MVSNILGKRATLSACRSSLGIGTIMRSQEDLIYFAADDGTFSMATGIALYERGKLPEYWVFAQKGEEAMKTLSLAAPKRPPGGKVDLDQSRWKPEGSRSNGQPNLG